MKAIELLSPAGAYPILKAVIGAGADAVYVGGPAFGARAYADNFSKEELLESIDYAHIHNRKVYLTVNTLLKEREMEEQLFDYLLPYYEQGLDAVIVQDFGVLTFIREAFPQLSIHASTQMTVTGTDGAAFLQKQGASRIVTARELSFEEIQKIKSDTGVEIESFVHGALCYCYSGECLLSSMLGGRSGNRGRCAQPCRLPYEVLNAAGERLTREATHILSPKDLCTIGMIPQLAECGIDSFKIEGRMKQAEYAAGVTSIYRKYIDLYEQYGREAFHVDKNDEKKLESLGSRSGFTTGYYTRHNGPDMITFSKPNHTKTDEKLHETIRKTYLQKDLQRKIKGNLKLFCGKNATLSVGTGEAEVQIFGEPVEAAQKKPLDKNTVSEKMQKTGNTSFVFESLEIEMDDDIFVPIGQLNALRRDALHALEEKLLADTGRIGMAVKPKSHKSDIGTRNVRTADIHTADFSTTVSVQTTEQLACVCKTDYVTRICLDADTFLRTEDTADLQKAYQSITAAGKEACFILPVIFRERTRQRYERLYDTVFTIPFDGIIVKNYEEIGFLQRHAYTGTVMADHDLYTYSNRTQEAFAQSGICRNTVPLELNYKELRHRDCSNSELLIYGYLPLMVSAGCIFKSLKKCQKKESLCYLKDRYGKHFAVRNYCTDCYNILYNSSPLALFGMRQEVESIHPKSLRMQFTTESVKETEKILSFFEKIYIQKGKWEQNDWKDYTNGHMKRGVE